MNELSAAPDESGSTPAALATASREVAQVQARYLMARRHPRNERLAVDRISNAFSRPRLAERASYEYVRGGESITGPSIHAAQAIAQYWGNVDFGFRETARAIGPDGIPYSEVETFCEDLESGTRSAITFQVRHWRDTRSGGYRLKDERDIYELTANMAQRRVRARIQAVIPSDVFDVALEQAETTLRAKADTSPDALARMVEAFAPYGVTKDHIETFIQRRLDTITPAQVIRLKRIFASVRDDIAKPSEWFDMGTTTSAEPADAPTPVTKVREAIRKKREPASGVDLMAEARRDIENAKDAEAAAVALDVARSWASTEDQEALAEVYRMKWSE